MWTLCFVSNFFYLERHAKIQNRRETPSGRKVSGRKEGKRIIKSVVATTSTSAWTTIVRTYSIQTNNFGRVVKKMHTCRYLMSFLDMVWHRECLVFQKLHACINLYSRGFDDCDQKATSQMHKPISITLPLVRFFCLIENVKTFYTPNPWFGNLHQISFKVSI